MFAGVLNIVLLGTQLQVKIKISFGAFTVKYWKNKLLSRLLLISERLIQTDAEKNVVHLCTQRQVIIQLSDCLTFLFFFIKKLKCIVDIVLLI